MILADSTGAACTGRCMPVQPMPGTLPHLVSSTNCCQLWRGPADRINVLSNLIALPFLLASKNGGA